MKSEDSAYIKSAQRRENNRQAQAAHKKRMREAGLVQYNTWIQQERKHILDDFAKDLRETPDPGCVDELSETNLNAAARMVILSILESEGKTVEDLMREVIGQYKELKAKQLATE